MNGLIWKIIPHVDLSIHDGLKIAELKNMHWPYGIDSQIKWMNANVKEGDFHLMGFDSRHRLTAYLTIVRLSIMLGEKKENVLGIGGVCVDRNVEHSGYGKSLVQEANRFISNEGLKGLLLCKDELVGFYEKCNWLNVDFSNAIVDGKIFSHRIMAYPNAIECSSMSIDRNF